MPTILLGRDQRVTLGGVDSGIREFDVTVSGQEIDVTAWYSPYKTTHVFGSDVTIKATAIGAEVYYVASKYFNQHPPTPIQASISKIGSGVFVITNISAKGAVDGVVTFEVTLKPWRAS